MRKNHWLPQILMVLGICLGFVGTVFSSLTYMAKDYNAYNLVYAFFSVSTAQQVAFAQLAISKLWLLRILNLSHISFVLCSALYALYFSELLSRRALRAIRGAVLALAGVQALLMDPQLIIWMYMNSIGPFANVFFFRGFYRILAASLRWIALAEIGFAAVLLVVALVRTPRPRRSSVGLVVLFFSGLSLIYVYLFNWLPTRSLWLSRVANYIRYDSLPINKPTPFNAYAPWLSILFVLSFCLFACYYLWSSSMERQHEQAFRSKISAVDTVSRVFCHYLKNELLSQQAELKLLRAKVAPDLRDDVAYIVARNDEIYQRLNAVHETIHQQKLVMSPFDLTRFLRDEVAQLSLPDTARIVCRIPEDAIIVSGNPDQLREVLACLVRNALEACQDNAIITLTVAPLRRYVSVAVGNNGPRVAPEKWDTIFDPFFTTKPPKSNWGLGLALCKNIVTLHRGRIWMDEVTENGVVMTTFHILLPVGR